MAMDSEWVKELRAGLGREPTEAEMRHALTQVRDRFAADWLLMMIQVACETHPDKVRECLQTVFDFTLIVERAKEADQQARAAHKAVAELCHDTRVVIESVHKDLEQVERRFDALGAAFNKLLKQANQLENK